VTWPTRVFSTRYASHLHVDLRALVERADHQVLVEDLNVVADLDLTGAHLARAGRLQRDALRAIAVHADGKRLDVQDDVGHVLTDARDRRELVENALDLDRGHRRALERRQQHATQRVAERQAEAALERLGDDGRAARGLAARLNVELARLD
jgi:hypothetical protein